MQEQGIVTKLLGDKAEIEMIRTEACKSCRACDAMGSQMRAIVANTANAKVGNKVVVELETGHLLSAAATVYLIPLIFFFTGLFLAAVTPAPQGWDKDLWAATGGFVMLIISLVVVKYVDKRWSMERIPKIVKLVGDRAYVNES